MNEKEKDILLSLQRALFEEISSNMRAIFVDWNDEKLFLYFIFDGEISEDNMEEASCVGTEFSAALSGPWADALLSTECIRIDAPNPIPNFGKKCVYRTKAVHYMNKEEIAHRLMIKLSAMRALLDHITPNIKAVSVNVKGQNIDLHFVFDSPTIEDEDYENAEDVRKKMQQDAPLDKITLHCIQFDSKEDQNRKGEGVFCRKFS